MEEVNKHGPGQESSKILSLHERRQFITALSPTVSFGGDSSLIVKASQAVRRGRGKVFFFVFFFAGEKELLNVNSSVMPPGAEMPSLFQVCCWSDGSVVEGGHWQVFSYFCFTSWLW